MNALIRRNQAQLPKGGQNPTPLAFFPGGCSGGYLFSSGGPTPTTPRQFLPWLLVMTTNYRDWLVQVTELTDNWQ